MRKRMTCLAGMAAAVLLALTACNEEAALTLPAEPQNPPVADNSGNVYITGDDFTWELGGDSEGDEGGASSINAVTRSQLVVDGNTAKFTWTPSDRVGILPDQGAQVWFEIPTPEEDEEPTNVATFDGGAWALKPTSDYAAYYPFVKDFDLDRTRVPVSYTGQTQTGNGTTAHLGAYDYQGARPSTTNGAGGVSFDFDHVGALVLLQFAVPTGGTQLTGVTLSADGAEFITKGTYDLTSTEGFPITATETSESMTIGLDYTTTADNEAVTLYFLSAPIDLSGKTLDVSVACGTEGETIELEADGKNLLAAGGCLMEAEFPTIDGTLGGKAEATAAEVETLVQQLKDYVDNGITTITVTGTEYAMYKSNMGTIPAFAEALYLLADNSQEESQYRGTIDLILPDATEIIDFSFDSANALKSITLPKVTTVGDGAFYGCQYLEELTFGSVVTAINQNTRVVFHWVGEKVEGCDLVLNCGQAGENSPYIPDFTANTWYDANNKFKSITLTHTGECDECKALQ